MSSQIQPEHVLYIISACVDEDRDFRGWKCALALMLPLAQLEHVLCIGNSSLSNVETAEIMNSMEGGSVLYP